MVIDFEKLARHTDLPKRIHKILAIGPLPPPLAGTSVSFETFCDEIYKYPEILHLQIINSAPRHLGQKKLFTTQHLTTAIRIIVQLIFHIWRADRVLVFGSNQFLNSILPVCLAVSKFARRPLYIRVFGGSLDEYYKTISKWRRFLLHHSIDASDGLIVQTELLERFFQQYFLNKVHKVPGYRRFAGSVPSITMNRTDESPLKLVFLGHVRKEKGIFLLLESLQAIERDSPGLVCCDIYGPVYSKDKELFEEAVMQTTNATFKGVLAHSNVLETIATYNVFVFPTTYLGEGHPGVLIEAMIAGLPIITTNHRSIPEIIKHDINGMLITPDSFTELTGAIQVLAKDRHLLEFVRNNAKTSINQFDSVKGVTSILKIVGVDIDDASEPTKADHV